MKRFTILLPMYNEESVAGRFLDGLRGELRKIQGDDLIFRLCIIDDGSDDRTWQCVDSHTDFFSEEIVIIKFAANYGKDFAIKAGIANNINDTDMFAVMDADWQHDPSLLGAMLSKLDDEYDIVSMLKINTQQQYGLRDKLRSAWYFLNRVIGNDAVSIADSDYKVFSRKVADYLNLSSWGWGVFRVAIAELDFKKTYISGEIKERAAGRSKWSTKNLFKYSWLVLRNSKDFVLKINYAFLGVGFLLWSYLFVLYIYKINQTALAGIKTIIGILLVQFVFLLVIYVKTINSYTEGRPKYQIEKIVRKNIN